MERLQKILSARGVCSRRRAEQLINAGRVTVNGEPAAIGQTADPASDDIRLDGRPLPAPPPSVTLLFHKPRGVVTTLRDPQGRKTIRDCLPPQYHSLVPVGRLDMDSEGLLLLSNDGGLVARLTHPSHEVPKIYHVTVKGDVSAALPKLRAPMWIEGEWYTADDIAVRGEGRLTFVLHEGKNRQIRRMCLAAGLTVTRLCRVGEGGLELDVPRGTWRELTADEIHTLSDVR